MTDRAAQIAECLRASRGAPDAVIKAELNQRFLGLAFNETRRGLEIAQELSRAEAAERERRRARRAPPDAPRMCIRPDVSHTPEALCVAGHGGFTEIGWASHAAATIAALRAVNNPGHSCYGAPIIFERREDGDPTAAEPGEAD